MSQDFIVPEASRLASASTQSGGGREHQRLGPSSGGETDNPLTAGRYTTVHYESPARGGSPSTAAGIGGTKSSASSEARGSSHFLPSTLQRSASPVYRARSQGMMLAPDTFLQNADPESAPVTHRSGSTRSGAAGGDRGESVRPSAHAAEQLEHDRETYALRDELEKRGHEVTQLKAALQRENEHALRSQAQHARALEGLREEHDRQVAHLREQLGVVKAVSEGAMQDKARQQADADKRHAKLTQVLEGERAEKARILAEYRESTEALIGEQAAEIQGLRALLEAGRAEEEKAVQLQHRLDEQRRDADEQCVRLDRLLAEERAASARLNRETEARHQAELDALRRQVERRETEAQTQVGKLQAEGERQCEHLRTLQERYDTMVSRTETERLESKAHYEGCLEALQEELQTIKQNHAAAEAALRTDAEQAGHSARDAASRARAELDLVRKERSEEQEAARTARECLLREHHQEVRILRDDVDSLRADVLEERTLRKDAEAGKQALTLKCDALQGTVARLTSEVERLQVDMRTRERQQEQSHLATVEAMRTQLRQVEGDAAKSRALCEELRDAKVAAEAEASESVARLQSRLVTVEEELAAEQKDKEHHQVERRSADDRRAQVVDDLLAAKVRLEADNHELQLAARELESRLQSAVRQLSDERDALDSAVTENHRARDLIDDLKSALESERETTAKANRRAAEAEAASTEAKRETEVSREAVAVADRRVRDTETSLQKERHEREVERESSHTFTTQRVNEAEHAAETLRRELTAQAESKLALQEDIRRLKDEIASWQREAAAADERARHRHAMDSEEAAEEYRRLQVMIDAVRDECAQANAAKAEAQREAADSATQAEHRIAMVQEALDHERGLKHRLHDELRQKEELAAEVQGTMRLLTSRFEAKEEEIRRLEAELHDVTAKAHEAHSTLGKRDANIGQLQARLKVLEGSRSTSGSSSTVASHHHHQAAASRYSVAAPGGHYGAGTSAAASALDVSRPLFSSAAAGSGVNTSLSSSDAIAPAVRIHSRIPPAGGTSGGAAGY